VRKIPLDVSHPKSKWSCGKQNLISKFGYFFSQAKRKKIPINFNLFHLCEISHKEEKTMERIGV
jgi:hypothetical protein